MLVFLIENQGHSVSRQDLLRNVWKDVSVARTTIDHTIAEIRHMLCDEGSSPPLIETVAGEGYCFIAKVEKFPEGPLPCEAKETLAILPFMTLGFESSEQWLGEGLADALVTRISALREIAIRPTGAVLTYSGGAKDPLQAGRNMHVNVVLEGTIQRAGERARVTLQLLRVADGKSLWAETYDEKLQDVFSFEDSVCRKVLRAIVPKLKEEQLL